jgi:hypothetical protein
MSTFLSICVALMLVPLAVLLPVLVGSYAWDTLGRWLQ